MNHVKQPAVLLESAFVNYGPVEVLHQAELEIGSSSLHALLGESGSGKTTLLRTIAGFEPLAKGRLAVGGGVVDDPLEGTLVSPEKRNVGVVFQDYALFPHLSVGENVGFGMKNKAADGIRSMLDEVDLSGYEERPIGTLSGGEQQRVALARAIAQEPSVILLDEPFSNLNRDLRESLRSRTCSILHERQIAALFVTHDAEEAFAVADRISVLHQGRILQTGTPDEMYDNPNCMAVARSLGRAHFFRASISDDGRMADTNLGPVPLRDDGPRQGTHVLLRSEQLVIRELTDNAKGAEGRVRRRSFLGDSWEVEVELSNGELLVCRISRKCMPDKETVRIDVEGKGILLSQNEDSDANPESHQEDPK